MAESCLPGSVIAMMESMTLNGQPPDTLTALLIQLGVAGEVAPPDTKATECTVEGTTRESIGR